ncbi:Protein FAM173B [Hondaea fermentalgiana]|uniref:Protein FAM173B n=1 Tax=Hondaea fermentalgiana TaxID=2315210 RepID=A0A2R5GW81_9STRA|nr:Protein FAM173B [Hondaea fermentalgiana]|eukprot:GBG32671.1 Protein FAM173B [Hondaea fermentalgiana]
MGLAGMIGAALGAALTVNLTLFVSALPAVTGKGAPYMPTLRKSLDVVFHRVLPKVKPVVKGKEAPQMVDLGSGDGRVVIEAARNGYEAVGYELNPMLVAVSQTWAWWDQHLAHRLKVLITEVWHTASNSSTTQAEVPRDLGHRVALDERWTQAQLQLQLPVVMETTGGLSLGERRRLNKKKRKRGAKGKPAPALLAAQQKAEDVVEEDDKGYGAADAADSRPPKTARVSGGALTKEEVARAIADARDGTLSDWLNPAHRHYWPKLKKNWKSLSKKERVQLVEADKVRCMAQHEAIEHPFHTASDDHCETAPEAYADVAPLLRALAKKLGKSPAELRIYDPYFCAGAVVKNLGVLGFENVYNKCEDFYTSETPEHDVLVTNPPYSFDHVERLLDFTAKNKKPALLLMPNYVCGKSYFDQSQFDGFLVPHKRYNYWTPKGLRPKERLQNHVSALGVRTSPFISFWYIANFDHNETTVKAALETHKERSREPFYVKDVDSLPNALKPSDEEENAA